VVAWGAAPVAVPHSASSFRSRRCLSDRRVVHAGRVRLESDWTIVRAAAADRVEEHAFGTVWRGSRRYFSRAGAKRKRAGLHR